LRAVFDCNVLISALLAPHGAPGQLLSRWRAGEFDLIVSDKVLAELERALAYPKVAERIPAEDASDFVALLRRAAEFAPDPDVAVARSPDAADDYLLVLAESRHAFLVSGDGDLLGLSHTLPVLSPCEFLARLGG
jgi:putative PIN family toxin of toxin-antitoxin system